MLTGNDKAPGIKLSPALRDYGRTWSFGGRERWVRMNPIATGLGHVIGLILAGSFLIFMRISPDWQIGAQGAILIIVLALRALINTGEARR